MKKWIESLDNTYKLFIISEETYNELIFDADNNDECKGYKRWGPPTDTEDLKKIMTEIYNYFGTHYFKVMKTVIKIEKSLNSKSLFENSLNIIDIGCNIGTATFAYIDLLYSKIKYYKSKKIYEVNLILIECSETRVKLLYKCIKRYKDKISKECSNIHIKYNIINNKFPNNLDTLNGYLDKNLPCIVFMSNVVNWIENEKKIAEGIHNINLEMDYDENIKVIHIENNNMSYKIKNIYELLNGYGVYDLYGPVFDTSLKFNNPLNSYYRSKGKRQYSLKKGFYFGKVQQTTVIEALLKDKLLKEAFEKTAYYQERDTLNDIIEIKYVRKNYNKIISNLKKVLKDGYVYNNRYLEYEFPKNESDKRPLFIDHFINELVSTALLLVIGIKLDFKQDDDISYGNRLSIDLQNPLIMKNYFDQYFKLYLQKAKELIDKGYNQYIKLDIKSYYTNVEHSILLKKIHNFLDENSKWFKEYEWFEKTLKSFINRNSLGCNMKKGLPQGPSISALLANVYLQDFDEWINSSFTETTCIRYVDDAIVFTNKDSDKLKKEIEKYLKQNLMLDLNNDKTTNDRIDKFTIEDNDEICKKINKMALQIFMSVYYLNGTNYKNFKKNPYKFCKMFHLVLKSINIYIPTVWLYKKLNKRKKRIVTKSKYTIEVNNEKITCFNINWGYIPQNKKGVFNWKKKFIKKNNEFMDKVNELIYLISEEFIKVYNILNNCKDIKEEKKIARRLKFLFNKLGTFTNNQILSEEILKTLFNKPWLINIRRMRAYPKIENFLIEKVEKYCDTNAPFGILISVWLLGEMKSRKVVYGLYKIFKSTVYTNRRERILLNILACESLLKINLWNKININDLTVILDRILLKQKHAQYQVIRNVYLILDVINKNIAIQYINKGLNNFRNDEYLNEFLKWLKINAGTNKILEFDEISEGFRRKYPLIDGNNQDYFSL